MDLSISIVSYNTEKLLRRCLTSIHKYIKGISFEVFVVDNASNDNSAEMVKKEFPNVKVIQNRKNVFFARANNQALREVRGKYFLILAPDAYFKNNTLKKMIQFMNEKRDVGACEGLEIYEHGTLVPNGSRFSTPRIDFYELSFIGKRFADKKLLNAYRYADKNRRDTFEIDVGSDAFLMVRKEPMEKIGGYDERFLLYYTENDLCFRIKQLGYKIVHFGDARVIHTVSVSVKQLKWKKLNIYYKDLLYYYQKHGYVLSGLLLFILLQCEKLLLRLFRPKMFG